MAETKTATDILKERVLGDKGFVSSEDTELDTTITEAITGLKTGRETAETGILAGTERAKIDVRERGTERLTRGRELARGAGPATSMALIGRIEESTEKSLRDLDLREKEALAAGQTETAGQIAALKIQQLQFSIQNKQQIFSNLLAVAGLETQEEQIDISRRGITVQERQVAIAEEKSNREERTEIGNIALEFGLTVTEDETLDSIIAKARPFASEDRLLALEAKKAEIAASKARTVEALRTGTPISAEDIDLIAGAAFDQPEALGEFLNSITNVQDQARVIQRFNELNEPRIFGKEELTELAQTEKNAGTTFKEAIVNVATDQRITNKEEAEEVLREIYKEEVREGGLFDIGFFKTGEKKEETIQGRKQGQLVDLKKQRERIRKLPGFLGDTAIIDSQIRQLEADLK